MKASVYLIPVCLCILMIHANGQAQKKSRNDLPEKEVAAIKAVIEKETKAFFEIDKATWASHWAHEPYAFWSFADTTDVNSFTGWEEIDKGFADYFQSSKPSTAKINRQWLDFRIYGNGAYVRFTQKVNDDTKRPEQAEVRVLEKQNGQWKIVCVNVIAIQKDNQPIR